MSCLDFFRDIDLILNGCFDNVNSFLLLPASAKGAKKISNGDYTSSLKSKGVETGQCSSTIILVNKIDSWYRGCITLYASYFLTLRIGDRILEAKRKKNRLWRAVFRRDSQGSWRSFEP